MLGSKRCHLRRHDIGWRIRVTCPAWRNGRRGRADRFLGTWCARGINRRLARWLWRLCLRLFLSSGRCCRAIGTCLLLIRREVGGAGDLRSVWRFRRHQRCRRGSRIDSRIDRGLQTRRRPPGFRGKCCCRSCGGQSGLCFRDRHGRLGGRRRHTRGLFILLWRNNRGPGNWIRRCNRSECGRPSSFTAGSDRAGSRPLAISQVRLCRGWRLRGVRLAAIACWNCYGGGRRDTRTASRIRSRIASNRL